MAQHGFDSAPDLDLTTLDDGYGRSSAGFPSDHEGLFTDMSELGHLTVDPLADGTDFTEDADRSVGGAAFEGLDELMKSPPHGMIH